MLEPLALAVQPLMPVRTPRAGRATALYGYHLRLADGPVLTSDDPLLSAFAASVEVVDDQLMDEEALQSPTFDPGLPVRLVREGVDEDGDEVFGVWDADEIRRAGTLPYDTAARVAASIDHGLPVEALTLSEVRNRSDDRRAGVALLVYPPELVTVDIAAGGPLQRAQRRTRPRLVLIADEGAGLRWWDPSGSGGPIELDALPVSSALADDLRDLALAFEKAPEEPDERDIHEDMEVAWHLQGLQTRTRMIWARVRRELGRRYAIGLMLNGMSQPAWSPEQLSDDEDDDDIPF
jgi:hypothetical protein